MKNVHILQHILIDHKIAILRDKNTKTKQFREVVEEITMLMTLEVLKDAPTKKIMVQTPLEEVEQAVIKENSIVIVPILRAGLGMVNGVTAMLPAVKVGHIGMARNEQTLLPEKYLCKLPPDIQDKMVIVLDPMLATGGSASATITLLKEKGAKNIKMLNILAVPEGAEKVANDHPDVEVYIAKMDRELNQNGYILPGLGDAGDRIFGTN
ncbi:MAG: uracil phosphoribosyltransferase [Clostridia bacterium]|nr:uracil phosphoribosyltransferase [Clostridia bacterium]